MRQIVELYADDDGSGVPLPVVFLHSLAGNSSQWSAQLEHLLEEFLAQVERAEA
jgi:pimeloyl-ACP methyl ester carboxylesterase